LWAKVKLRSRIYIVLAALVGVSLFGGLVMIWYTYQMDRILMLITEKEFAGFQMAEALENAVVNQKGFVSYYFLDGDPEWLRKLGEYRQVFNQKLKDARSLAEDPVENEVIEKIASEYRRYIALKDQVLDLYKAGRRTEGAQLHKDARSSFFKILELCEVHKKLHVTRVQQEAKASRQRAESLRIIAGFAVLVSIGLAVILAIIFIRQILNPVAQLLRETGQNADIKKSDNIVNTLSLKVHNLIADVDQTQKELKKSQEHLVQSEKMALVGKLAAGMAHSIRNPFTSVKMRLFSLNRSLNLSPDQLEDFKVISDEIRHIDTIVQNFLEFSRPPKLKMQEISPSVVVDAVVRLLSHRLKSYDVSVRVIRNHNLPEIYGDPEQLKEVLVNLMVNACEAVGRGGEIVIQEKTDHADPQNVTAVIHVSDNGPGVPENLQGKIFQPFFTTKEEGTGLGLSIAGRIIEEHMGTLAVVSEPGRGTTFKITLPTKESNREHHPDHR
jgi:signal transduction histidine kinase